jgi:hypothetical protein
MPRLQPVAGTEIVDDIRLGHTWDEYNVLKDFILNENPKWFIEVGVHEGGLSYLLLPELDLGYIGIEIDCGIVRPAVVEMYKTYPKADLFCVDCFSDVIAFQVSHLENKIIYCDGGNKSLELQHFDKFCVSGDIIMAHDYHDGIRKVAGVLDTYQPEVHPKDILHLSTNETFERLSEHEFKETRIVGFRKIK